MIASTSKAPCETTINMSQPKRTPTTKEGKKALRDAVNTRQPQVRTVDSTPSGSKDKGLTLQEKSAEYQAELDNLWHVLRDPNTSEERREAIVKGLSKEVVEDLRVMRNPMKKPVFIGDDYKILTFSIHNMMRKYAKRFAMTSLVAYTFKMMTEYEPASAKKYPSENEPLFVNAFQARVQAYEREKPAVELKAEWERVNARIPELKEILNQSLPADADKQTLEKKTQIRDEQTAELAKLIKDTFLIRARMIKFNQFYLVKDQTSLTDTIDGLKREVNNLNDENMRCKRAVEIAKIKLTKRRLYEDGKADEILAMEDATYGKHKAYMAELARTSPDHKVDMTKQPPEVQATQLRMIEELLEAIDVKPTTEKEGKVFEGATVAKFESKLATAEEKLANLTKVLEPQLARLDAAMARKAQLEAEAENLSKKLKELREQYDSRYRRPADIIKKKREDLIKGSSTHPFDDITVERADLTEDEFNELANQTKKDLGIEKTAEEHTDEVRATVEGFLLEHFKYNADNHVSCSYNPNYGPLEKRPQTGAEVEKLRKDVEARYGFSVVPPDDTFYRWNRYEDNHYEALRQATDDIYAELSDMEFAIVPYRVFEGKDPAKVDEQVKEFQRKYAGEVEADIMSVRFGSWSLLDSWEENREKRDIFSAKTEVIRRMIQKNEEDAKIGDKINRQRQEKKKRENIKEHGPDAPGLDQVKKSVAPNLQKYGAKPHIMGTEVGRDDKVSNKDEVEVGVTQLEPSVIGKRGRVRTRPNGWKIHIDSEPLQEGQAKVQSPSEFMKTLIEKEARGEDV